MHFEDWSNACHAPQYYSTQVKHGAFLIVLIGQLVLTPPLIPKERDPFLPPVTNAMPECPAYTHTHTHTPQTHTRTETHGNTGPSASR